jgi:hypothetical protein
VDSGVDRGAIVDGETDWQHQAVVEIYYFISRGM